VPLEPVAVDAVGVGRRTEQFGESSKRAVGSAHVVDTVLVASPLLKATIISSAQDKGRKRFIITDTPATGTSRRHSATRSIPTATAPRDHNNTAADVLRLRLHPAWLEQAPTDIPLTPAAVPRRDNVRRHLPPRHRYRPPIHFEKINDSVGAELSG
jgi:hypothetical protein